MATWAFHAYDLASGARRGELPVVSWTHTETLNDAGSFAATLQANSDQRARELIAATLNGRTVIVPTRNNQVLGFAGIVAVADYPNISGGGLLSYFDAQTLDETLTFAARDQHLMVVDLVQWVQAHDGNIGVDVTKVAASGGFFRDQVWYAWEEKNIGEAIRQKSAIINGFDFDFRVELDADQPDPVRRLRMWTPRRGRPYEAGSSALFSVGGRDSIVTNVPAAPRDASKVVTHVYGIGAELPSTDTSPNPNHERLRAITIRRDLLNASPPWPRYAKKLDLSDIKTLPTLQEHTDGYAAQNGGAALDKVTLEINPNHGTFPWGTYELGDDVRVEIPVGAARWWPNGMSMTRRYTSNTWIVNAAVGEHLAVVTEGGIDVDIYVPPVVVPVPPPIIVDPDPPPIPGPSGEGYVQFFGTSTNVVTIPRVAGQFAGATDLCIVLKAASADWTPGALAAICGKYFSTTNQRSWELRLETSGALSWQWSSNGTSISGTTGGLATSSDTTTLASLPNFGIVWIAVTHDINNGAGGNDVRFWYSLNGTTFTQLGSTVTGAFTTSFFDSTSLPTLGAVNGGALRPWAGRCYDLSVRTGTGASGTVGGTEVWGIRNTVWPIDAGPTTPQTFTSTTGQTATATRSGDGASDVLFVPAGSTAGEPTPTLNSFFPIGVYGQPTDNATMAKWVTNRGINTFVFLDPSSTSVATWSQGIVDWNEASPTTLTALAYQIRPPHATPTSDIVAGVPISSLLAWAQPEDPDKIGSGQVDTSTIQANYATWIAITGHPPVFINVTGRMDSHDNEDWPTLPDTSGQTWYKKYFDGADWISGDRYPVNEGVALTTIGSTVDQVELWSGGTGKPAFAWIETSDYNTSDAAAAPTPEQMRGEIWSAIIHGARGIVYYPHRRSPTFSPDATPVANATEMTVQNGRIKGLAAVLQNPIDPSGFSAAAPSPMEVGWRNTSTHRYFICLNLSGTARNSQTISLSGAGGALVAEVYGENRTTPITSSAIVDNFGPYECHIYKVEIIAGGGGGTPTGGTINHSSTTAGALAATIAAANPGDTIIVAAGTYPSVTTNKISSGAGITIRGASRTGTIIQGIVSTDGAYLNWDNFTVAGTIAGAANVKSGILLNSATTHHQNFTNLNVHVTSGPSTDSTSQFGIRLGAHHVTISGCTVDAANAAGGQARCVTVYGPGNVVSEANYCHDIVIENNTLTNADSDCVFMYGFYNVRIQGNTIGPCADNTDHNDFIQIVRGWHDCQIIGNTFVGQNDQCIQVNGKNASLTLVAYGLTIQNNTTVAVTGNGLSLGGAQSGIVSNNDFSHTGVTAGYGLVLWSGELETGFQEAPAGSVMDQNRNMTIINNTFGTKYIYSNDLTANGVNGNVINSNDITIGAGAGPTIGSPPNHPLAVQGPVASGTRYVSVTWDRNDTAATGYQLFRDASLIATRTLATHGPQGMCSYTDVGVSAGSHTYTIKATYPGGISTSSRAFTIVVLADADFGSVVNVDSQAGATDLIKAQAAVNAADAAGGGIVVFAARTYNFSGPLVLSNADKVVLRGAGIDSTIIQPTFLGGTDVNDPCNTAGATEELIYCDGTRANLSPRLTIAIAAGDRTATFNSVTGFSVGQILYFDEGNSARSPHEFNTNLTNSGSVISPHVVQDPGTPNDQRYRRDANEILSIAGNVVTFRYPFIHAFTTAVVPEHITSGNRNRIESLTLQGPSGNGRYYSLVYLNANKFTFADTRFRWSNRNMLQCQGGFELNVVGCIENNVHVNGLGGICKYRFSCAKMFRASFVNNTFGNSDGISDHSFISIVQSARFAMRNNTFFKSDTYSFDSHGQGSWDLLFENNTSNDNFSGVRLGNPDWGFAGPIIVRNNSFRNCGRDIESTNNSYGLRFLDNQSDGNTAFVIFASGWDNVTDTPSTFFGSLKATVKRNVITNAHGVAFQFGGNDGGEFPYLGAKDFVIADNNIASVTGSAIAISGTSTESQRFQVFNNSGKNAYTKPTLVSGDYWATNADATTFGSRSVQSWEAETFGWEQYDGA